MTPWPGLAKPWTFLCVLVLASVCATTAAAETKRLEVRIVARAVAMESNTLRVSEGDRVELTWTSDEAVKLHLHGYDVKLELEPGQPGVMSLEATTAGRFPVSHHGFSGEHAHGENALIYLEVYPQ